MRQKASRDGKLSHTPPHVEGIDAIDRRILIALQNDATMSLNDLSERINLSTNACWRRVKKMEEDGIILGRVALLDHAKLGYGITAFVTIRAGEHTDAWVEQFAATVASIPEIVECYRMTGEVDYLLKILAPDLAGYDLIYKRLIRSAKLADVSAGLAMEAVKSGPRVPL